MRSGGGVGPGVRVRREITGVVRLKVDGRYDYREWLLRGLDGLAGRMLGLGCGRTTAAKHE
jgi:hypothetical protein